MLALVEAGVLDRDRDPLTGKLEQRDVVRAEVALLERADVQHPDEPVLDLQRYARHRLDARRAQKRAHDLDLADVAYGVRLARLRDLAGEAAADRDSHAALDLLGKAAVRRARNQRLLLLVEHQH